MTALELRVARIKKGVSELRTLASVIDNECLDILNLLNHNNKQEVKRRRGCSPSDKKKS